MGTSSDPDTAYAPATALTSLLGDHGKTRILAVFLSEGKPVSVTHVAQQGDMSRSTVYRYLRELLEIGVIANAGTSGRERLFEINRESDVARLLAKLEWELVEHV